MSTFALDDGWINGELNIATAAFCILAVAFLVL